MMAMARAARAMVAGLLVGMPSPIAHSFGSRAAGSLGRSSPKSSFNWLTKIMTAIPAVNPTVTGNGMYLMYVPSRRKPTAIMMMPAMIVARTSPS
jgi:hypothetical protein